MNKLGLIGFPLSHSFSQKYFSEKFMNLGLEDWIYELYPIQNLAEEFKAALDRNPELIGLNVTIPHKVNIINYLDEIDEGTKAIGAVNTIKISIYKGGKKCLKGYNTDVF